MNYHKNELINECLEEFYATFQCTLDTADYVPEKYNAKILAYIFKQLKRQFRKIDKEDRAYQRALIKQNADESNTATVDDENNQNTPQGD